MLKTIVKQSPKLAGFVLALELALFQPQMQHLTCILDSLIVCDTRKTLCNLYRQWVDDLDPKAAADFFRESPWLVVDLSTERLYELLCPIFFNGCFAKSASRKRMRGAVSSVYPIPYPLKMRGNF